MKKRKLLKVLNHQKLNQQHNTIITTLELPKRKKGKLVSGR